MTTTTAPRALALLEPNAKRLPMRWRPVVYDVCRRYDVSLGDVMSGWRDRETAKARHAVWYEIHTRFGSALAEIGRRFGFHHTSVMHGINLHRQRLAGTDTQQY